MEVIVATNELEEVISKILDFQWPHAYLDEYFQYHLSVLSPSIGNELVDLFSITPPFKILLTLFTIYSEIYWWEHLATTKDNVEYFMRTKSDSHQATEGQRF